MAGPKGRSPPRLKARLPLAPFLAAAAAVMASLSLLTAFIGQPSKAVAERIPKPDYFVGFTAEGDIWLRGRVNGGMLRQFARVRGKQGRRVILTSSGGSASDGISIAEIILENRMDTVVRGACYSACANYLFFAGRTKTVEPGGLLGFHGWPWAATDADRERVAAAILRRRPQTSAAEVEEAFQRFKDQSARDIARQTAFYNRAGVGGVERLMRVLDADPVNYTTGRAYRGGRYALVPTRQVLERCFGVRGLAGYTRPARLEPIDWASPLAPRTSEELALVWTREEPDCGLFTGAAPAPRPRAPERRRRMRLIQTAT